ELNRHYLGFLYNRRLNRVSPGTRRTVVPVPGCGNIPGGTPFIQIRFGRPPQQAVRAFWDEFERYLDVWKLCRFSEQHAVESHPGYQRSYVRGEPLASRLLFPG